jgi:hypothetical protein
MDPEILRMRVQNTFPQLEQSEGDFTISLPDCRAVFFCTHTGELDFQVTPLGSGANQASKAITAIEILVPSTDALWEGLRSSLRIGRLRKYPTLIECAIKDAQSRTKLLVRDSISPLLSSGAKLAYAISFLYCILGVVLVLWQLHIRESADIRTANILTVTLSLGIAAVSVPIPIVTNWREWKKSFSWRYARV